MQQRAQRPSIHERVTAAILDGAAEVFAAEGLDASIAAVASASGVARATVYRYFPNRDVLLSALADLAVTRGDAALAAARIAEVAPAEGIRRAVRALIEV